MDTISVEILMPFLIFLWLTTVVLVLSPPEQFFSYLAAITITGDRTQDCKFQPMRSTEHGL
jgi:hypothetical protein